MDVSSRGGRAKREEGSNHEMLTKQEVLKCFQNLFNSQSQNFQRCKVQAFPKYHKSLPFLFQRSMVPMFQKL